MTDQSPSTDKKDAMLEICKAQGYVPEGCLLPGPIVWMLINQSEDPCAGCNHDRSICGGRPKKPRGIF